MENLREWDFESSEIKMMLSDDKLVNAYLTYENEEEEFLMRFVLYTDKDYTPKEWVQVPSGMSDEFIDQVPKEMQKEIKFYREGVKLHIIYRLKGNDQEWYEKEYNKLCEKYGYEMGELQ